MQKPVLSLMTGSLFFQSFMNALYIAIYIKFYSQSVAVQSGLLLSFQAQWQAAPLPESLMAMNHL